MAYSLTKCQALAARITKAEDALDAYLTGERVIGIQDGPERTDFQAGSAIESGLRRRIEELKRQYETGSCAVVMGDDDTVVQTSRRALRPIVSHR